jgi:hypothetical protein
LTVIRSLIDSGNASDTPWLHPFVPAGRPSLPAVVQQLHSELPATRAMTITLDDRLGNLFKIFRGEPSGMMMFAMAKLGTCVVRGVLAGLFTGAAHVTH